MKKSILISDSFKGTLSTFDIMSLFQKAYFQIYPNSELISFPVSDGGEGFIDSISTVLKGNKIEVDTIDANLNPIKATYFIDEKKDAYIESASCVGLSITKDKNPSYTSTKGNGLLIIDAIKRGVKKIYLALGGTSTNDAGTGLLAGLGVRFFNRENKLFLPTGITLSQVVRIDTTALDSLLHEVEVIGLCDVKNPLLGKDGATYVYALQKGAKESELPRLEENMSRFVSRLEKMGRKVSLKEGTGAAGGLGFCILHFLNGKLQSGIDTYLDCVSFEEKIKGADVIFTGEGRIDSQTKEGKVISGILKKIDKKIPVVAICGSATKDSEDLVKHGLSSIVTTTRMLEKDLSTNAKEFYYITALNTLRLIHLGEEINGKIQFVSNEKWSEEVHKEIEKNKDVYKKLADL